MGRPTGLGTGWLGVTLRYILYRLCPATRAVRSSQREEFSSHLQKTWSVIRMYYLLGFTRNRFNRWDLKENGDNDVEQSSWVAKWIKQSLLLERGCVRRFGEQMEFSYCSSMYSHRCLCILIVSHVFLDAATLTEVFPCFFLGYKANTRV